MFLVQLNVHNLLEEVGLPEDLHLELNVEYYRSHLWLRTCFLPILSDATFELLIDVKDLFGSQLYILLLLTLILLISFEDADPVGEICHVHNAKP